MKYFWGYKCYKVLKINSVFLFLIYFYDSGNIIGECGSQRVKTIFMN